MAGLAPVTAIEHVINCPGILDAQFSRHAGKLAPKKDKLSDPICAYAGLTRLELIFSYKRGGATPAYGRGISTKRLSLWAPVKQLTYSA